MIGSLLILILNKTNYEEELYLIIIHNIIAIAKLLDIFGIKYKNSRNYEIVEKKYFKQIY